ncbi:MAG: RNA-binding protein [Alkaliphilus sp.]|nr:MAG: RNA-binding protein [Alkaliphilus sp.]
MKELVRVIIEALVDQPEKIEITETEGKQTIIIEIKVAQEDMGKVIGKQGRIAKAMRTVVKSAAMRDNKKVIIEIVD